MSLAFDLLRPDDLVALHFEAVNLDLDLTRPARPRLVVSDVTQPALLVVRFPPQSLLEQAFFQTDATPPPAFNPPPDPPPQSTDDPLPAPGAVGERLAGDSRLVLRLPAAMTGIDYTAAALLDWSQLELVLAPVAAVVQGATPDPAPAIAVPGALETAIELPYRLMISPTALGGRLRPGWSHALQPVVHAGRAELWHTRLVRVRQARPTDPPRVSEASEADPLPLRALWSPDFVAGGPLPSHTLDDEPFRSPMTARDRDQIVILTSGYDGYRQATTAGESAYAPQPVNAARLMLSALGGWLTSNGSWPEGVFYRYFPFIPFLPAQETAGDGPVAEGPARTLPPAPSARTIFPIEFTAALDLVAWRHVSTQGRDHYVRIVYAGYLYPFGHRASLVKVSERKVASSTPPTQDSPVAWLRQRMFVVVREPQKNYAGAPFAFAGREMPMGTVTIDTKTTPDIDPPVFLPGSSASFWIDVGPGHFPFKLKGVDVSGHAVDFLAPLIFVSDSETSLAAVQAAHTADDLQRRAQVRGHNVAYADPAAGDTTFKTTALIFGAELTGSGPPWVEAPFIPTLDRATVTIPSLTRLLGQQVPVVIGFYAPYLASGLDAFAGVFAEIVSGPPAIGFSADKAGGFATPNLSLTAVSARKGLISGEAALAAAGRIKPSDFFGAVDARLFGTIPLGNLIPVDPATLTADATINAPTIRNSLTPDRIHPTAMVTKLAWQPAVQDFSADPVKIEFNTDGQPSELTLSVAITRQLDGSPASTQALGRLTFFRLSLLGVVAIRLNQLQFTSKNGAKTIVVADLANTDAIVFEGPLSFVQTLADVLPPGLFGGQGPSIEATSKFLRVSYTLGLPPITCGVFSLQNIAILTALQLPWLDGKPAFEFGFAKRSKPFLVTVEIFGGGGFVHVILDASGIQMVEGAIEFGGNFAFDVGVASGGVHAMAGVYFQLKGTSATLTGFIDIGGEVSVLGIISISLDLNLSLSWLHAPPKPDMIDGKATMTVSVHVLFFSASVSISVEKQFKAGAGDPQVWQLMNAGDWSDYATAFA